MLTVSLFGLVLLLVLATILGFTIGYIKSLIEAYRIRNYHKDNLKRVNTSIQAWNKVHLPKNENRVHTLASYYKKHGIQK